MKINKIRKSAQYSMATSNIEWLNCKFENLQPGRYTFSEIYDFLNTNKSVSLVRKALSDYSRTFNPKVILKERNHYERVFTFDDKMRIKY